MLWSRKRTARFMYECSSYTSASVIVSRWQNERSAVRSLQGCEEAVVRQAARPQAVRRLARVEQGQGVHAAHQRTGRQGGADAARCWRIAGGWCGRVRFCGWVARTVGRICMVRRIAEREAFGAPDVGLARVLGVLRAPRSPSLLALLPAACLAYPSRSPRESILHPFSALLPVGWRRASSCSTR